MRKLEGSPSSGKRKDSPLFNSKNYHQCFILHTENEVIGHIGYLKSSLDYHPFAMIGGVCLKTSYRGKGLFRNFFNHILEKLQDSPFILLWGDKIDIYSKFGFKEFGLIHDSGEKNPQLLVEDGFTIQKLASLDGPIRKKIISCYSKEKDLLQPTRSPTDWETLFTMKSIKCAYKEENKDFSYCFYNKGFDFPGIIHEYGSTQSTLMLIRNLKSYRMWTNPYLTQLTGNPLYMGMIKYNKENFEIHFEKYLSKLWIPGATSI